MKEIFACHGIPELVRNDNGLQYSASKFASFALEYGYKQLLLPSEQQTGQKNGPDSKEATDWH